MPVASPAGVFLGTVRRVSLPKASTGQPSRAWVTVPDLTGPGYVHGADTGVPVADLPPTTTTDSTGAVRPSGFPALADGDRVIVGLLGGRADRVIVLARLAQA
jgi:hypothetical protein